MDGRAGNALEVAVNGQQQTYVAQFPKADHDIILLDGCAVGRVLVERTENEIRGVDIALLPQHRSAGIGSLVIKNLMAEAEKAGKPFRIQVVKSNRAARLYDSSAFQDRMTAARTSDGYSPDIFSLSSPTEVNHFRSSGPAASLREYTVSIHIEKQQHRM